MVRAASWVAGAALLVGSAQARAQYDLLLPNAEKFSRGKPTALGHFVNTRSVDVFGNAFRQANRRWTVALCMADSDGDGVPNGAELGDPDCKWTQANPTALSSTISDPGNPASKIVFVPPTPPTPPPTTGNPTVAGAPPTQQPTPPPSLPPTPPGTLPPVPEVAEPPPAASGNGAAGVTGAAATSAGGPSIAVIAAAGSAAALVVLAVVNQRNKSRGAAAVAHWQASKGASMSPYGHSVQSAMPQRGGQPGSGVEIIA
jgi:hypothetical protein